MVILLNTSSPHENITSDTPDTLVTLDTVNLLDSNLSETPETLDTPETLEAVNDLDTHVSETLNTLDTVSDLDSNVTDTLE